MSITLISNTAAAGSPSSVTTSPIVTTGASLIVISVSYFQNVGVNPPTDSQGNTWTALTSQAYSGGSAVVFYYCSAPSTSASHTFTESGGGNNFPSIAVMAFSGTLIPSPVDNQNGANASASTIQTGNITPSNNGELIISSLTFEIVGTITINSGFTIPGTGGQINYVAANNYGCAMAYLIQTGTTSKNPLWTNSGGSNTLATTIASFKSSSSVVVPITAIEDKNTLQSVAVTDSGALRTATALRIVGAPFVGTVKDPNFWTETDTGSGGVSQQTGAIVMTTGTTANSTSQYQSNKLALFIPGSENTFRCVVQFGDTGTVNNIRIIGASNGTSGIYFQLSGTQLSIVTLANSVATVVNQGGWNVNTSFILDTNFHQYEIRYTFLGIYFFIDQILVHQIVLLGSSSIICPILDLPINFQNNNVSGGTTNCSMTVVESYIMRTGALQTESVYAYIFTPGTYTLKYGPGKLHNVIVGTGPGGTILITDGVQLTQVIIANLSIVSGSSYPITIPFDCSFTTGLTIAFAGQMNVTITYE